MRKTTATLLGAAATVASLVTLAGPAQAGDGRCDPGDFCAWEHIRYGGRMVDWYGNDANYSNDGMMHAASSWANRGLSGPGIPDKVILTTEPWHLGYRVACVYPGSWVAWVGAEANDKAASHRWAASC